MQKINICLPEIKLIGITARTNYEAEINPETAKIGSTVQKYFQMGFAEKIAHRVKAGTTYCIYTDYEKDHTADYTYFIGEEVSSFENVPEGYSTLTIPPQNYIKFTNGPGIMPQVCISVWAKVWQMLPKELGGERAYIADFEVYDERAQDRQNTTLDVYVGIKE